MTGTAGNERLGIAGSGAIACGLARAAANREPPVPVILWARSDASAERATGKLDGCGGEVTTDLAALGARPKPFQAADQGQSLAGDLGGLAVRRFGQTGVPDRYGRVRPASDLARAGPQR